MSEAIFERIKSEIKQHPIMIFMKGDRVFPQCGFSGATVRIFEGLGVPFETRDVLSDPELRDGIKRFSNWPTVPQVYVAGEFIGGCDIVHELHQQGELAKIVQQAIQ
ncbi:MAG: Grx4 family monothiol glutaredoxin [Myxococcota bacterium]